jgi:hypothetical protein
MNRRMTLWHGTEDEAIALLRAFDRVCTQQRGGGERCVFGPRGERLHTCAAHRLLMDQRALDGLLWMRQMAPRLCAEEFHLTRVMPTRGSSATGAKREGW